MKKILLLKYQIEVYPLKVLAGLLVSKQILFSLQGPKDWLLPEFKQIPRHFLFQACIKLRLQQPHWYIDWAALNNQRLKKGFLIPEYQLS